MKLDKIMQYIKLRSSACIIQLQTGKNTTMFDAGKTSMLKKNYDDMLSRFQLIPERYGRTDRQICYINIAHQYADAR